MNGLRVYINHGDTDGVFYSRRDDGPFYCWCYQEQVGQWRVARVSSSKFSPRILSTTSWKVVPAALQRSIREHYQE